VVDRPTRKSCIEQLCLQDGTRSHGTDQRVSRVGGEWKYVA
jgi:hypothetical protein